MATAEASLSQSQSLLSKLVKRARMPHRRTCGHWGWGKPCPFETHAVNGAYAALRTHEQNRAKHGATTAEEIEAFDTCECARACPLHPAAPVSFAVSVSLTPLSFHQATGCCSSMTPTGFRSPP